MCDTSFRLNVRDSHESVDFVNRFVVILNYERVV